MRARMRLATVVVVGLIALLGQLGGPAEAAVPGGFRVLSSETLDPGIQHSVLRSNGPQEVHVARLAPGATGRLRSVLASDVLSGPAAGLETTSSMCARVACVVGVNGDFADLDRQPVGGMVSGGELVRSQGIPHAYFEVGGDGRPTVGRDFNWAAELRVGDRGVAIAGVNRPQAGNGPTLYSSRWGPSTGTDATTTELVVELRGANKVPSAGETAVRLVELRPMGNGPIGPGQVVVAARGAAVEALSAAWQARSADDLLAQLLGGPTGASLRVSTGGARDAVGASPQLLSGGATAFPTGNGDSFTQDRHPRTMAGITAQGEVLLVTVDGRQPGHSTGLSLTQAAELLRGLGAVHAVNLDGGGSTTFVTGGRIRNRPSDAAGERRVVSALVVVPAGSEAAPASPAPSVSVEALAPLPLQDPASRPPNLLGDLLPPLQKALDPVVKDLGQLALPMTDMVTSAIESLLAPFRSNGP